MTQQRDIPQSRAVDVFLGCDEAIRRGTLIHRATRQDKEFHFQNWLSGRLGELNVRYDPPARNTYPDFRLVEIAEGYEVKGLAYPGREATYDSNSQVPSGYHNGRKIYYIFGCYPKDPDGNEYPVIDLVMCHGDFLNADHEYVHENKSIRGFGSYGDIMIRDRKMYVSPTPFALTDGTTAQRTLILPKDLPADPRLEAAGDLVRTESDKLVVSYTFDVRRRTLAPKYVQNPAHAQESVLGRKVGVETYDDPVAASSIHVPWPADKTVVLCQAARQPCALSDFPRNVDCSSPTELFNIAVNRFIKRNAEVRLQEGRCVIDVPPTSCPKQLRARGQGLAPSQLLKEVRPSTSPVGHEQRVQQVAI